MGLPINTNTAKLLLMGLYESGKSTIRSVVFDGKDPKDFTESSYKATINYHRDIRSLVGDEFVIFDLGGQENYLRDFVGEKAEFIFSDVRALVWVVDVNNIENVSVSNFYFDLALKNLVKFSPEAEVFCLLHKADLVLSHLLGGILETLKEYFTAPETISCKYFATSIFDKSIFAVFSEITKLLISKSSHAVSIEAAIKEFLSENVEISGITIYTEEGLPAFEEGSMVEKIIVPANLWLSNSERLSEEFKTDKTLKSTVETDEYIFVFQRIKEKLLLTGLAKKVAPTQFVLLKIDQLSDTINKLL